MSSTSHSEIDEEWACRLLARTMLNKMYGRVVRKCNKYLGMNSETYSAWINQRKEKKLGRQLALYRRLNRTMSDVSSNTEQNSRDLTTENSMPLYKRFSRIDLGSSFSSFDEWPLSFQMTPQLGKQKIIDYIHDKWSCTRSVSFSVDFLCVVRLCGFDRFKYCSTWKNKVASSRIYFNLDASTIDRILPVKMTFSLPGGDRSHRPSTSHSHLHKFLRRFDHYSGNNN